MIPGTFVPFDTAYGLYGPSSNGFSAGTYVDGSQAYVGVSDNSQAPCIEPVNPSRISVNPAAPGGYVSCLSAVYKPNNNLYLREHPNLLWVPATTDNAQNIPSALKVTGNGITLIFGRILISGFAYVGKSNQNKSKIYLSLTYCFLNIKLFKFFTTPTTRLRSNLIRVLKF